MVVDSPSTAVEVLTVLFTYNTQSTSLGQSASARDI